MFSEGSWPQLLTDHAHPILLSLHRALVDFVEFFLFAMPWASLILDINGVIIKHCLNKLGSCSSHSNPSGSPGAVLLESGGIALNSMFNVELY